MLMFVSETHHAIGSLNPESLPYDTPYADTGVTTHGVPGGGLGRGGAIGGAGDGGGSGGGDGGVASAPHVHRPIDVFTEPVRATVSFVAVSMMLTRSAYGPPVFLRDVEMQCDPVVLMRTGNFV